MSDDIVFKFVSLRPPVQSVAPEAVIEAGEHGRAFEVALEGMAAGLSLRERLIGAARGIRGGAGYVLNRESWLHLYRSRLSQRLLDGAYGDLESFQGAVSVGLGGYGLKVGNPDFLAALWTGYLASIFSEVDARLDARFFHEWIHIADLIARGRHRDLLPLLRLALPAQLSWALTSGARAQAGPNDNPAPGGGQTSPAGGAGALVTTFANLSRLSEELTALSRARRQAYQAAQTPTSALLLSTRTGSTKAGAANRSAARARVQPARAAAATARPGESLLRQLDIFRKSELTAASQTVLEELRLDEGLGINAVTSQVANLLAETYARAASEAAPGKLGYTGGTVVRLRGLGS